jgi:hypothetical protein
MPVLVLEQVVEVAGGILGLILVDQFNLPLDGDDVAVTAVGRVHVDVRLVETQVLDVVVHELVHHRLDDVGLDLGHVLRFADRRRFHYALLFS